MSNIINIARIGTLSRCLQNAQYMYLNHIIRRNYAAPRKRFYRKTGILFNDGKYEVRLDQRKLKTPNGSLFTVESEPLALAVAAEWDAQKEKINQSSMYLTLLCNTAIDNPNKLTKYDLVQHIINYIDTDTVLFHSDENEEFLKVQTQEWDPIIDWFCKRFQVNIAKSKSMSMPVITEEDKAAIAKYLMSYNFSSVHGFVYGVDTLKSVILTLACVERFLSPEKAALLSRLEEEFQLLKWGRVEWAHDLNQQDLQARISATVLYIYFNSSSWLTKTKEVPQKV